MTAIDYPPMQDPASFNLEAVKKTDRRGDQEQAGQLDRPMHGGSGQPEPPHLPRHGLTRHTDVMLAMHDFVTNLTRAPSWSLPSRCSWLLRHLRKSDPLPSWNDGAAKQAIVDFVAKVTQGRLARLRAARRAHRDVRQRRHAVGRAADVLPARVRAGPGEGARAAASGVEGQAAVQGGARRRHEGAGGAARRAHAGDHHGAPMPA